nr:hypothetical protein CFP56_00222 [Quercus suber]
MVALRVMRHDHREDELDSDAAAVKFHKGLWSLLSGLGRDGTKACIKGTDQVGQQPSVAKDSHVNILFDALFSATRIVQRPKSVSHHDQRYSSTAWRRMQLRGNHTYRCIVQCRV